MKVLQELVLANSHIFTEFDDCEESPKKALLHCCCCYDVAVMWALEPLGNTLYIYIYIYAHGYSFIAFHSAVRQIYINYSLNANVATILASRKTSSDYMAYVNIIPTFSWLRAFVQ